MFYEKIYDDLCFFYRAHETCRNWFHRQPDNHDTENCVELFGLFQSMGLWNDISCHYERRYLCAIPCK